jgi:hypothetical protein
MKFNIFLLWTFVITFLRIIVLRILTTNQQKVEIATNIPKICQNGITNMFANNDVTYSTYLLCFTTAYFITPLYLISNSTGQNVINYSLLSFFILYILFDLFIKKSLMCIPQITSKLVFGEVISGLGLGMVISGAIMYGTNMKNKLFVNEINSNKEVCSMPSKQKFKCSVYKNGELVSSSIS